MSPEATSVKPFGADDGFAPPADVETTVFLPEDAALD